MSSRRYIVSRPIALSIGLVSIFLVTNSLARLYSPRPVGEVVSEVDTIVLIEGARLTYFQNGLTKGVRVEGKTINILKGGPMVLPLLVEGVDDIDQAHADTKLQFSSDGFLLLLGDRITDITLRLPSDTLRIQFLFLPQDKVYEKVRSYPDLLNVFLTNPPTFSMMSIDSFFKGLDPETKKALNLGALSNRNVADATRKAIASALKEDEVPEVPDLLAQPVDGHRREQETSSAEEQGGR